MQRLLIEENEFDHLIDMIEDGYEANHEVTLEADPKSEDFIEAQNRMRTARRMLDRLCDDHPLLDERIRAGDPFDWEDFWKGVDTASREESEAEEAESPDVPVAEEPAKP